jgi:hypothetical protein
LLFWLLIVGVVGPHWAAKKQLANQKYLGDRMRYVFEDDGFRALGPNTSWEMRWGVVREIRETKSLFLIYHAPNIALPVPKRFFASEGEQARWKEFAALHIPAGKFFEPVLVGRWF